MVHTHQPLKIREITLGVQYSCRTTMTKVMIAASAPAYKPPNAAPIPACPTGEFRTVTIKPPHAKRHTTKKAPTAAENALTRRITEEGYSLINR